MVLPEVNSITIHPNGNDRWIFDYRVTFEFADPDDFNEKHVFYSSHTSGVILDQDNNKHSGVYQGPSFPGWRRGRHLPGDPAPGDIPPVQSIPLALVRRKLDEFINTRNGTVSDARSAAASGSACTTAGNSTTARSRRTTRTCARSPRAGRRSTMSAPRPASGR